MGKRKDSGVTPAWLLESRAPGKESGVTPAWLLESRVVVLFPRPHWENAVSLDFEKFCFRCRRGVSTGVCKVLASLVPRSSI